MRCTLAIAVLLAGCSAAPASQDDPLPLPPDPPPAPIAHQSPPATVATLTPPEIVLAAEQAHRDASGYVAWRPTDVVAARAAVRELRSFLANKGD
jgi:hypothetical protein